MAVLGPYIKTIDEPAPVFVPMQPLRAPAPPTPAGIPIEPFKTPVPVAPAVKGA